jgi:hypothetical protein
MDSLKSIIRTTKSTKQWLTYSALFLGFFLVLLSIQLFLDSVQLLHGKQQQKDGFDYLVVNKIITNSMMGNNANSYFTNQELEEAKQAPGIDAIATITSNQFPIAASTSGDLGFYTQLFFESVPDEYLDITLEKWSWTPGNTTVPVILSADFLNLYNFGFALSQGLPQLSEETIKALSFDLTIGEGGHQETYRAEVAGFTQRYSSVLVPNSFMTYANVNYGNLKPTQTSRIILKTKEADNPKLVEFLQQHNYATQQEKIKLSKLKTIVNWVFGGLGLFGLFILTLAIITLRMYIELQISKSADKLRLLALLGYKPKSIQSHFTAFLLKMIGILLLLSLFITSLVQVTLSLFLQKINFDITLHIHLIVVSVALLLYLFTFVGLKRYVSKIIQPFYTTIH